MVGERILSLDDIYDKLEEAEESISAGNAMDGFESLKAIRKKHNV